MQIERHQLSRTVLKGSGGWSRGPLLTSSWKWGRGGSFSSMLFSNLTRPCQPNCPTSFFVPSFPTLPAYGCFLSTLYGKIETGTSGNTLRDWKCWTFTPNFPWFSPHREVWWQRWLLYSLGCSDFREVVVLWKSEIPLSHFNAPFSSFVLIWVLQLL